MKKVTMETSMGAIALELDDEKAPETVANFVRPHQNVPEEAVVISRVTVEP